MKDPRAVEAIMVALKDEKATVRRRAAVALGEIQDTRAEDILITALKNGDLEVIAGAHAFYIRRGEPATETMLIKALQEYGYTRMAENFARCGNPKLAEAGRDWA
jgi:HEAT repeat protein